jgi:SOS response regulatory protein OraA/RecX
MSVKLAKKKNDKKIEPKHALSAIILFILTEREHTKDELFNKLSLVIDERSEFENIISDLFYDTYIEMHDGKIQINIAELI